MRQRNVKKSFQFLHASVPIPNWLFIASIVFLTILATYSVIINNIKAAELTPLNKGLRGYIIPGFGQDITGRPTMPIHNWGGVDVPAFPQIRGARTEILVAHSDGENIYLGDRPVPIEIIAGLFGQAERIWLLSCLTGNSINGTDSLAQQLADYAGIPVVAPAPDGLVGVHREVIRVKDIKTNALSDFRLIKPRQAQPNVVRPVPLAEPVVPAPTLPQTQTSSEVTLSRPMVKVPIRPRPPMQGVGVGVGGNCAGGGIGKGGSYCNR